MNVYIPITRELLMARIKRDYPEATFHSMQYDNDRGCVMVKVAMRNEDSFAGYPVVLLKCHTINNGL